MTAPSEYRPECSYLGSLGKHRGKAAIVFAFQLPAQGRNLAGLYGVNTVSVKAGTASASSRDTRSCQMRNS